MTDENERKKEYLEQYQYYKLEKERLAKEYWYTYEVTCPPINYSGMPSAHNNKDLSDYLEQRYKSLNRITSQINMCEENMNKIDEAIEKLQDCTEKMVLKYRYKDRLKWEKIAEILNYSRRQVNYYHGSALKHFSY